MKAIIILTKTKFYEFEKESCEGAQVFDDFLEQQITMPCDKS